MKKTLKIAFWVYVAFDIFFGGFCGGFLPLSPLLGAQTILTMTTLSAAVPATTSSTLTTGQMGIVSVASATNINAPGPISALIATPATSTFLFVDRELMDVRAVSGTTLTVVRGISGTAATSHLSGALVFVVPGTATWIAATGQADNIPAGSCARASELYLPRIDLKTGTISDCIGGQWVNGDAMETTRIIGTQFFPAVGAVLYTGLETNGTAFAAATTAYCQTVDIPYNKYVTGAGLIMGTTAGGAERKAIALYDGGGVLLANQPTGSSGGYVPAATASVVAKAAFVTPYYVVGPARYFACAWSNGTSDTIRHTITGTAGDQVFTSAPTTQVFGTYPATITAPSSFTTAQGPYIVLY